MTVMTPPTRNRRIARWALASLALVALLVGCSVEKNYRTLSFFFDGVPDPNAPKDPSGKPMQAPGGRGLMPSMLSIHKPYADEQCKSCHKEGGGRAFDVGSLDAKMCLECHKEEKTPHAYKHAVIAHPECLWCHDPHQSEQKLLLRGVAPALCMQCHDHSILPVNPPVHQDPASDCLSCHYAHGGADRRLLKPGAEERSRTIPAPAAKTRPATAPENPFEDELPGGRR